MSVPSGTDSYNMYWHLTEVVATDWSRIEQITAVHNKLFMAEAKLIPSIIYQNKMAKSSIILTTCNR